MRLNPILREAPRTSIGMTLFLCNSLNLTFPFSMSILVFLPSVILCEDPITPLRVTVLSRMSAHKHIKGRKTKSLRKREVEDTVIVVSEMWRF